MVEQLRIGDITLVLTRKAVKHVHLSVHPPDGRVTLTVPNETRVEVARAYAISRIGWIRDHQATLRGQAREAPRWLVTRETHYLWGRRRLLKVVERNAPPHVTLGHRDITLSVRPGSDLARREAVMHAWHKGLLHKTIPAIIARWEPKLGVSVAAYFLQKMKTKWGSCNHRARHIRINTELAKKPKDLLEYVVVHEMVHLIAPTHSERFVALLSKHYPSWREARKELNELPIGR